MIWFPFFLFQPSSFPFELSISKTLSLILPVRFRSFPETLAMVCLRRLVGFTFILLVFKANGVQTGVSGPLLACHVPLEVKIFADSSYQASSADLKPCTHIILSSANALFLPSSNASLASILVSEKRSLELLKQQTPEAEFSFSLRSSNTVPATRHLKTIFNGTSSVALLVEFLRINKLKSFDIAWDLIQSAPDYGPQLKSLRTTLGKEGFSLTTTIGVEVDRIDAFNVTKIASIVDRIFLVSSYNRHYSGSQYPLTEKKVEQPFDALELNEGTFLKLYSTLNLSWKKIVVGLSLKTLVWKLNLGTIAGTQFSQYQAVLQLQNYYESCKTVNSSWRLQQQPTSPFYQLAVAPNNDQWMIHIDPLTLGRRVDLLKQYGFGGVALYDYYQDDFAGICNPKGKIYPMIEQAGRSIRNGNLTKPFPKIDVNNGFCIPFLGLTSECNGAFNLGTPEISTTSLELTSTSTSSTVPVTRTTFPVVNNTPTRESYAAETGVTVPSSSTSGATIAMASSWAQVADAEHLVRTRRSSVSSSDLGTEPSFSYLRPPGFDLVDIAPSLSSSNSNVGSPASKSSTTTNVTRNIVTKASKGKVEPSHDNQTNLSDAVTTTISQTLELPTTAGNQAMLAIQETTQSTTDIVSSKVSSWKFEIPTAAPSFSNPLSELDTFAENEPRIGTPLRSSIENGAPAVSPTSTSEIDRTTDSTIVSTVPSSQAVMTSFQTEVEPSNNFEATTEVIMYVSDSTENTVPPSKAELDLHYSSTTRPQAAIDQDPTAPSQYSGFTGEPMEQITPELSTLADNNLESPSNVPMHSAITDVEYEAPVLQELVAPSVQQVKEDDESTSAFTMSTEYPSSTLLSTASLMSNEDAPSSLGMDFSTPHVTPIAEEDVGEVESEKIVSSENTFSVEEWHTSEGSFSSETPLIHSTVFNMLSVKESLPEDTGITWTEDPSTAFADVSITKEVASVLEEGPVESNLPSQIFFSNIEPLFPMMDDDLTSLMPDMTEISTKYSSSSPTDSITPIEETSFFIHLDISTTQTPIVFDASTVAIASTDNDFVKPDPVFGKSQSETTLVTDFNEIEFTEPFQETFSGESAVPTTSIDVEMAETSTEDEINLPAVSLNEKITSIEIAPTTLQTSTESSFPIFDESSSTIESIPPFTFADSSSTYLNPNIMESSTQKQYFDSSLSDPENAEEIQSSNDLSTPDDSTVVDITSTENNPSSATNLSLELEDSEGSSSGTELNSHEVFTESEPLFSTSTDIEIMDVQTVSNKEIADLSSTTLFAEELVISELSSVSMETSAEVNPSVSNEVSSTFEPIPHSDLRDTSSTPLYNIVDLLTTNSPSLRDVITAETKLVDEKNEFVSSTTNSLYLEDSQTNLSTDVVVSSRISFAADENNNVDTTLSLDTAEPTESVPVSTIEDDSHIAGEGRFSSTIYASLEQTSMPLETNPSVLMTVSTDPSLLHSTSMEITSSSEGYELSTPVTVASSNEDFAIVELSPIETGTSTEGSSLIADEFSGTSELPSNFVDTSPFSIPAELPTARLNFLTENSITFSQDAQILTADEFQTLPILHEVTNYGTALMDKEDDGVSSTTSLDVEDYQPNIPTLSSVIPIDMSDSFSGSFEDTVASFETNPSVLMTDSPTSASFQSFDTLDEQSGDFPTFEPSLSTTSPPISGEVQPFGTDLTTSDEELTETSTPTLIFENESLEDHSFLTQNEDGSGTSELISTDQPHETVSIPEIAVTASPITILPSSLAGVHLKLDEDLFTSSFASIQISDTSESSTISDISSTDVTFESTAFPIATSAESIVDTTVFPSQPATYSPIELSTPSVLPLDYDVMASSTTVLDNNISEGSGYFLGSSRPLVDSFVDTFSTDPSLPYTLENLEVTSIPENVEGSAISAVTSSEEQFAVSKSSPSILEVSTEGATLMSDEFSGASELPHGLAHTSTFFMPSELSTNHLNFISENPLTLSTNMQNLIEEKLSSSVLPILSEITTSGTEPLDIENSHVSPTTSLMKDFQSNVPSEETRSSPIPFDMSVSFSGSFEPVMTDSLTTASLLPVDISDELSENFVSFGPTASNSLNEFQQLADFTTSGERVSTVVPIFENEGSAENSILTVEDEGSAENSILTLEDEGSGTVTLGFLNATAEPSQTPDIISEIDLTTNGVSLPFSSPAASIWETLHTFDGTSAFNVESTSASGVSDNLIEQELPSDSFAAIGTTNVSPLSSSSEMAIALTLPTTSDNLSPENPSSQLPMSVTGSAGSQSSLELTTPLPSFTPNVLHLSSPIFDAVTVSLKPPSAYNMIASSTGVWNNPSSVSSDSPLDSFSGSSYSPSTSTTDVNTPDISTYSFNSFPVTFGASWTSPVSTASSEFPPSTTSGSATVPSSSSSTIVESTTSSNPVPSSSTNSAIVMSISPNASEIPTTVPPIINLWNLLIGKITTADRILFLTKNVTSISPLTDGITSFLHKGELEGSSTSSMPSPNENSENSDFVTRPFWLVNRPNGNSPFVLSTSQTFSKDSTPTSVAMSRTTTPNAEPSVRTSTIDSFTHSDLFLTRPVWLQNNSTKLSKLTTTRPSSPTTSSTEGRVSIIITYQYKPSKFNELSVLHDVTSESTPSTMMPLPITSSPLNLSTNANLIVNGHAYIKNCTEHVVHSSSSVTSVTDDVVKKVIFQMNMTADMANQLNSSFHFEKWSEALNQFLSSHLKIQQKEIQSSIICEAAEDSILLKSLLCFNQSPKGEHFQNLMQLIKHLAPAIIANLTTAMNQTEIQNSVNVTDFEINHSSMTPSGKETSTESTVPISTESTTMSTLLMQHFTESFLLNLTTSFSNRPPLPTVLNISLESLMENLTEQLKDTQLTDVISAVNRLSQNIPESFLENIIQNNNSNSDTFFGQPVSFESVKDVIIPQEQTSTTMPTTEAHNVLEKDFWKTNRRNPFKTLQRVAGAGRVIPPSIGLSWRRTMKPVSSIFRSFAKPAVVRL
ncbi:serine-rich adhesin for platelets-like isoform X2 [Daphnia carinata]|uniref:serine-rich adhesin for platelets-like isoform X2 n=1 Tax=Daphnia carinata TaxID=120202 RepID=UPI00257B8EB9|nr:serine-rich adhesin for platelets-like isoform X2 [Daphnia carinata]